MYKLPSSGGTETHGVKGRWANWAPAIPGPVFDDEVQRYVKVEPDSVIIPHDPNRPDELLYPLPKGYVKVEHDDELEIQGPDGRYRRFRHGRPRSQGGDGLMHDN